MKFKDIKSLGLKKALGAKTVRQSYHNKHVDGSGNFGIVIHFPSTGAEWNPYTCWDLHGVYDSEKNVRGLRFGTCSSAGVSLNLDDDMVQQIKSRMQAQMKIPW